MTQVLIALGANIEGAWGTPAQAVARAVREMGRTSIRVRRCSPLYVTPPAGGVPQPDYVNAVALATTSLRPAGLLATLKRLERKAGRERGALNGPRPLDLDIIACAGLVVGWPVHQRRRGGLIVPHPLAHRRAFVLRPLLDVAPRWVHPVLHMTGRQLLRQLALDAAAIHRLADCEHDDCSSRAPLATFAALALNR